MFTDPYPRDNMADFGGLIRLLVAATNHWNPFCMLPGHLTWLVSQLHVLHAMRYDESSILTYAHTVENVAESRSRSRK